MKTIETNTLAEKLFLVLQNRHKGDTNSPYGFTLVRCTLVSPQYRVNGFKSE